MSGRADSKGSGRQQILISGVGGQGVLFVSRLLADAAIRRGEPVLTSETHGMAQRGGVVVSHLKVGDFASPLIRASRADGLIVLKEENLARHRGFLKPAGWAVVNAPSPPPAEGDILVHAIDADGIAQEAGNPRAVNLVLLGFALSRLGARDEGGLLFCTPADLRAALHRRPGAKGGLLEASLGAFELGILRGTR